MDRLPSLTLVSFLLLVLVIPTASFSAQTPFDGCDIGVFAETGAEWAICMPERIPGLTWNGDLIIYAHGYVPDLGQPLSIPVDQYVLPDGTPFPYLTNQLGYAFATTSFRTNGLAVKDGVADIMDLLGEFKEQHPLKRVSHVYLFGASEGGLITAKAIEQHQAQFDGGIAACGPIGDFRMQVNYVGDMRVVFDAFFPGILPPTAIEIPESLMLGWETVYAPAVTLALSQNAPATVQLLNVTQAAIDPVDLTTVPKKVLGTLWYNVYSTNDAYVKMGGNPYDNADHTYVGSADDTLLNQVVLRYQADRNALASVEAHYQTTGRLKTPLVTLHNTMDPVVPYEHALLYGAKVTDAGASGLYTHIPVESYAHCNFNTVEIMGALNALLYLVQKSGN
jgi:pimeloyl-ACP methyl ester carboxylesterase